MTRRTPLHDLMLHLGARMTKFAGWELPLSFHGILQEHQAVRTGGGLFDISHMGRFELVGVGLIDKLQPLVPTDLSRLQPGQAQYTVLLNPEGGILDDLIFYYQGGEDPARGLMIVNAGRTAADEAWLQTNLPPGVRLENTTSKQALIAFQGPRAALWLQPLVDLDLEKLPGFSHSPVRVLGQPGWLARTGYTGEDGFELLVSPQTGEHLWRALQGAGAAACGLGARDTLRLEAALGLYGLDLDESTTPLEAGLSWLVDWSKGEFIGREALSAQKHSGLHRRLVGLTTPGRHIPRHGYPLVYQGQKVGEVTSGTLAPSLGHPIALGYVPRALSSPGQTLGVEIRGQTWEVTVAKRPFYRRSQ